VQAIFFPGVASTQQEARRSALVSQKPRLLGARGLIGRFTDRDRYKLTTRGRGYHCDSDRTSMHDPTS